MSRKSILVTGANSGIGLALCKQLVRDHKCHVIVAARSEAKASQAVRQIIACSGESGPNIATPLIMDVGDDKSVVHAARVCAAHLGSGKLYAIVNNAGTGLSHGASSSQIFNVNTYGPKRVVDNFKSLLQDGGRIVNVGSGAAPMYYTGRMGEKPTDQEVKTLTSFNVTWEQIDALVTAKLKGGINRPAAYGLSKAALSSYTMALARTMPGIISSSITPGFIATSITTGMGASKTPAQGTVSIKKCLFADLQGNGWYYGSDGLRSPLTTGRNPGEPEYQGPQGNPGAF